MRQNRKRKVCGALKNMKGALAEKEKNRLHKDGLSQGGAEINALLRPNLTVVDGLVDQQGLGPIFGEPVEMNLILAGDDPVAMDTVLCHIMKIDPEGVACIGYAQAMGLGTMDLKKIELIGTPISAVARRFKLAEEDTRKIEIPGFEMMRNEKSCTGCRNTM